MERILSNITPAFSQPSIIWLARLRATFKHWLLNARTRRQLALLDQRLLADAGISPSEREAELAKPFWH
ncbi:hypothetical protein D3C85_563280 [compost metagenome]